MPLRSASRGSKTSRKASTRRSSAAGASTRKPTADNPSPGISRVDQPSRRTHGYVVRLDYRKTANGYRPRVTAFFGDISHGGRRAAWEAAEKYLASVRRKARK